MRYLSLCSGIEAATVAWEPLGWKAAAYSEIEPFPCSLLKHYYPDVPNLGDMTEYKEWNIDGESIDLVCGGTPCQSFSVAGLRKGMDDPRGSLVFAFLGVVNTIKPRWVVFENVTGLLSSGGGRDFGAFLGALAQLGYGWCYRVLDAQYFGVPQRRRRIFVVGYLGNWRGAAAVLFERESLRRDLTPGKEAGQEVAAPITVGSSGRNSKERKMIAIPINTMAATRPEGSDKNRQTFGIGNNGDPQFTLQEAHSHAVATNIAPPLRESPYCDNVSQENGLVCECVNAEGSTGQPFLTKSNLAKGVNNQTPLLIESEVYPLCGVNNPSKKQHGKIEGPDNGPMFTLGTYDRHGVAISVKHDKEPKIAIERTGALQASDGGSAIVSVCAEMELHEDRDLFREERTWRQMAVRRLTPRECERLMGMPDDYTLIRHKGKPASDTARYKAIGNSWAVPPVRWLGRRIQMFDEVMKELKTERNRKP